MKTGDVVAGHRLEQRLMPATAGVETWGATELRLQRRVDLVLTVAGAGPDEEAAFTALANAVARVDSPHVPSVLASGRAGDRLFLSTRHVDGDPIGDLIAARGPLPHESAAAVVAQVALALAALHEAGVVHGRVEPGSVLVRDPDVVPPFVLLSATAALVEPEARTAADPLGFLAPERLNGAAPSAATDLYALGCVFWACLTGRPPWQGSDLSVAQAHLNAPIPRLVGDSADVRRANAVLSGCLAKDPAERFASAREVAMLLQRNGQLHAQPTAAAQPRTPAPPTAPAQPTPPAMGPAPYAASAPTREPRPDGAPHPPPAQRRRGTRVGLVIAAAVVLIGGLIGAVVTAVVVWGPRDGTPGPATEGDVYDNPTAQLLKEVAQEAFPEKTVLGDAYSRSWSTEPGNIVDGLPRKLEADEWDTGNWWSQPGSLEGTDHEFNLTVAHAPPDVAPLECRNSTIDKDHTCEEFTSESGTVLTDTWTRINPSGTVVHMVTLPPDPTTDRPEVTFTEVINDLPVALTLAEAKQEAIVDREAMATVVDRDDLQLPLPNPPPLPSYDACTFTPDTTAGCPKGLL